MKINPGLFDKICTLHKPTSVTSSDTGAVRKTFTDINGVWVYINDRVNNEVYEASKRSDVKQITLEVRYSNVPTDVDTTWQLTFEGVRYQIISCHTIDDYGRQNAKRIRAEAKL